jgi:pimeloyl-ACP methyl ester carboxylesterase
MNMITTKDGTEIYKDWGDGPVVTFSHGWPLSSDAWDGQMLFLAQHGFRVVAHDRPASPPPIRTSSTPACWPSSGASHDRYPRRWPLRPGKQRPAPGRPRDV